MLSKMQKPWTPLNSSNRVDEDALIKELEDIRHQWKTAAPDVSFRKENQDTASADDDFDDDIGDDNVDYVVDSNNEDGTQVKKAKYCGSIRGSRDVRETGIPFVVDKDCKCGKSCLRFLRSGIIYFIY